MFYKALLCTIHKKTYLALTPLLELMVLGYSVKSIKIHSLYNLLFISFSSKKCHGIMVKHVLRSFQRQVIPIFSVFSRAASRWSYLVNKVS